MTVRMEATEAAADGSWFGVVSNSGDDPLWVEVHAEPTSPMSQDVLPAAGLVPAKGDRLIGFVYSAPLKLVMFSKTAERPLRWRPLSEPFPVDAGFRLVWGDNFETVATEGFPQRG